MEDCTTSEGSYNSDLDDEDSEFEYTIDIDKEKENNFNQITPDPKLSIAFK